MSDEPHIQIQLRRGTAEEWANSSPQPGGEILAVGEPGFEKDTGRLKIGDGVTGWNELAYNTSSIVVEDIDSVVSEILVPGSGISFDFSDSANSLTISQNAIQTFANNSVLTSDGTSTGIVAEPNMLFDGMRITIKCNCPAGTSGLTMIGDGRSTLLRSNVYSDEYEIETEDGTVSIRNTSRMIFLGTRGSQETPAGLEVGDELFIIRGDGYNPHGTLNANGILDSRTSRISSSITATGTHYLGSSIFLKTSTGGPTLWDNTLVFDHTGVLSINSVPVSLDGHSHKSSDISDFNDAVTALVGGSGGLTIESIQDNIANSFLVAGSNVSLNYDDEADTLTISSTGGGGTELPYLELTNKPFIVLPAVLGEPDPNFFEKTDYGSEVDTFVEDSPEGAGVGITRGNNQGIYNPYQEEGWAEEASPLGTEWNADGWDSLANITSRTYGTFYNINGGQYQVGSNVVGTQFVMRLTGTQTYYAIQFINWTQGGNGGGFSYLKYQINLDELQEGITFSDGTVLKSAEGIGRVKSTASNNRRIEEVYGSKTVSVTQITANNITSAFSRSGNGNAVWIDSTTTNIDEIMNNPSAGGVTDYSTIQFSLDNNTWYTWNGSIGYDGNERQYGLNTTSFDHTIGDPVYFRYNGGGVPQVWWDKNELPGGASNFRGAVIDYHCYTGEGTHIGTIHIVDDDGEENITHTEVSSGSTDSENDDLWLVQNEGTISYRRMDGESKTAKFHWAAKIFYGSELYD